MLAHCMLSTWTRSEQEENRTRRESNLELVCAEHAFRNHSFLLIGFKIH